jgi:DNA polymerase III alpha subunit
LRSIWGVPEKFLTLVEAERNSRGEFVDINDFVRRTSLPRSILLKLAAAGAFAFLGNAPRDLIWQLESLSLDDQSFLWGHAKESFDLDFSEGNEDDDEPQDLIPFESNWEKMQREYNTKGFSVDSHPLSILRSYLQAKSQELIQKRYVPYMSAGDLPNIKNRNKVRVAGLVSITQRPPTAKGMCFITLEDEFGFINIVIPPDIYQKDRVTIYNKSLLEIHGTIEKVGSIINVKAQRVLPLT